MDATTDALQTDFERGATDGRTCGRHNQPIPALAGGAYAVGFLFGYRGERRRRAGGPGGRVAGSA
jgi:hypothetical protein